MPTINLNVILAAAAYAALTGIFNLLLGHKSQVEAWAESNPKLAAILKFTRALGFDPWNLIAAISLIVQKKLPEAQKSDSLIAQTEQKKADAKIDADETVRIGPLLVLLFCCSLPALHGCALFSKVNWGGVEACAIPSDATLAQIVSAVLAGNGDVEKELTTIGEDYGYEAVKCAVQQIVADLRSTPKAERGDHSLARGQAFLVKVQK